MMKLTKLQKQSRLTSKNKEKTGIKIDASFFFIINHLFHREFHQTFLQNKKT